MIYGNHIQYLMFSSVFPAVSTAFHVSVLVSFSTAGLWNACHLPLVSLRPGELSGPSSDISSAGAQLPFFEAVEFPCVCTSEEQYLQILVGSLLEFFSILSKT